MSELREHTYHAEASVLSGQLHLPVKQEIQTQAFAKLPKAGGYLAQQAEEYRLESVISYKSAHTQVAGHLEGKGTGGYRTLVTSVVEGLNILNVVTADRVVGQISTLHPLSGHVPRVTFLGTGFENLRIGGHRVYGLENNEHLDMDLEMFANRQHESRGHLHDPSFLTKLAEQHRRIQQDVEMTPEESALYSPRKYNRGESAEDYTETVECSLVNHVRGSYPGTSFGHLVRIPHFGFIKLAQLKLVQSDYVNGVPQTTEFHLTMIDVTMGCIGTGTAQVARAVANGTGKPHAPPPPSVP